MREIEMQLDACHGECCLRLPAVASLVQTTLLHSDGQRYRLVAWVIMPNHVHVVMEVFEDYLLSEVVQVWKSYTAHGANRILCRKGAFWAIEYFDRFIRDAEHYDRVVHYIHENPVKAGLVQRAEEWPYSSAYQPGAQASSPA